MPVYSLEATGVIGRAQLEARRLGFPFVQREQLFLGLLQEPTIQRILSELRIDLGSARSMVEERLLPGLGAPDDPGAIGVLPTAEQVFQHRAQAAAAIMRHTTIRPEHILLGFLLEQHGVVLEVLTSLGLTKDRLMEVMKSLDA